MEMYIIISLIKLLPRLLFSLIINTKLISYLQLYSTLYCQSNDEKPHTGQESQTALFYAD